MKNSQILKLGLISFVLMIYSGFTGEGMITFISMIVAILSIFSYRIDDKKESDYNYRDIKK